MQLKTSSVLRFALLALVGLLVSCTSTPSSPPVPEGGGGACDAPATSDLPACRGFLTLPFTSRTYSIHDGWYYPGGSCHWAMNYVIDGGRRGADIVATADGWAISCHRPGTDNYGWSVRIHHANGWETFYAHMDAVQPGIPRVGGSTASSDIPCSTPFTDGTGWVPIRRGDRVGGQGDSGNTPFVHLHFEVQTNYVTGPRADAYGLYTRSVASYQSGTCGSFNLWTACPPRFPERPGCLADCECPSGRCLLPQGVCDSPMGMGCRSRLCDDTAANRAQAVACLGMCESGCDPAAAQSISERYSRLPTRVRFCATPNSDANCNHWASPTDCPAGQVCRPGPTGRVDTGCVRCGGTGDFCCAGNTCTGGRTCNPDESKFGQ